MLRALLIAGLLMPALLLPGESYAETKKDEADPLKGLEYRQIGPAAGGRLTKVSGVAGDPLTWYIAAAQGGIFKSSDGGFQWTPLFDKMPSSSVGAMAVAQADPNVIYVGGGEANTRGNVQPGEGLFVSTDAGTTWQHTLKARIATGQIAVHPKDASIAYAAVLGSPFASGGERGLYRTTDTGKTWQRVLDVDADSGVVDVSIDAHNPRIVWAGSWDMRRSPWDMRSGGKGSGLWRSADGGDTWTRLISDEKGLPKGEWGKVGVAVSPADGSRVYALIEADEGGLFRSDDAGETFTRINEHWVLRQRAWYYMTIVPHPTNRDEVWFPQVRMQHSSDGGKTLAPIDGFSHGDHHDIWIDPQNPLRQIGGHDGGVDLTIDGGAHWRSPDIALGQFYNIDVDQRWPYHVGGTLQDMGTTSGPVLGLTGGTNMSDWLSVGGGEAGDFRYDREIAGLVYAGEYGGFLSRHQEGSGQYRTISPVPTDPLALPASAMAQRFQWTAPIELSPHDAKTLYHGSNVLYRSRDRGETWSVISLDLTFNDKTKQGWAGGPITGDNTGVEVYGTIFAINESPLARGELWVGSDDGRVHVSIDDAATWRDVTPKDLPRDATVNGIYASRHAEGRAYLIAHRYRLGDDRPFVWVTDNRGSSWRSLASSLPKNMPLYSLAEDETDPSALYLGAERAVYASVDGGKAWKQIQLNLPPVAVVDLVAAHGDLVLGTRGRGIWVFHGVRPLLASLGEPADRRFPTPSPAVRWHSQGRWGKNVDHENPDGGAIISYYLNEKLEDELTLTISDSSGVIRELSSVAKPLIGSIDDPDKPAKPPKPELSTDAGWHRVTWDLRHSGVEPLTGAKLIWGDATSGPLALPGTFQISLSSEGIEQRNTLEVVSDPRAAVDQSALAVQLAFAKDVLSALKRTRRSIEWVRAAHDQATHLSKHLGSDAARKQVADAADTVISDASRIEGLLHNPDAKVAYDFLRGPKGPQLYSQLVPLYGWSQGSDDAPTAAMLTRLAVLQAELMSREADVNAMRAGPVATLEAAVSAAQLPRLLLP